MRKICLTGMLVTSLIFAGHLTIAQANPDIEVIPLVIDFGEVEIGNSITDTITVNNISPVQQEILNLFAVQLSGDSDSDFTIITNPAPISLQPGESADIEIAFAPSAVGSSTAILQIISNDPANGLVELQLSGIGVPSSSMVPLILKGFEIFKGNDVSDTERHGTKFWGKIYAVHNDEEKKIGLFCATLNFSGTEFIERCGGVNDILWFRLELFFTQGKFRGKRLIFEYEDTSLEDVFWDFDTGEICRLGGKNCHCPPLDLSDEANCDLDETPDEALIAWVGNNYEDKTGLELALASGSSSVFFDKVERAAVQGYLCHQYPIIPRILGLLNVYLNPDQN